MGAEKDPWSHSLLSPSPSPTPPEADVSDDPPADATYSFISLSRDSDLRNDLDLSLREDRAVLKETPFTLAKLRAKVTTKKTGKTALDKNGCGNIATAESARLSGSKKPLGNTRDRGQDWKTISGWTNAQGDPIPHCPPAKNAKRADSNEPEPRPAKRSASNKTRAETNASKAKRGVSTKATQGARGRKTVKAKGVKASQSGKDDKIEFHRLPKMDNSQNFPIVAALERQRAGTGFQSPKQIPIARQALLSPDHKVAKRGEPYIDVDALLNSLGKDSVAKAARARAIVRERIETEGQAQELPSPVSQALARQAARSSPSLQAKRVLSRSSPTAVAIPDFPVRPRLHRPIAVRVHDVSKLESMAARGSQQKKEATALSSFRYTPQDLASSPSRLPYRSRSDYPLEPSSSLPHMTRHDSLPASSHPYPATPKDLEDFLSQATQRGHQSYGNDKDSDDYTPAPQPKRRPAAPDVRDLRNSFSSHQPVSSKGQPSRHWNSILQGSPSPEPDWTTLPAKRGGARRLTMRPEARVPKSSGPFHLPQRIFTQPTAGPSRLVTRHPDPVPDGTESAMATKVTVWTPSPLRNQAGPSQQVGGTGYVPTHLRVLEQAASDASSGNGTSFPYPTPEQSTPHHGQDSQDDDWADHWRRSVNIASRPRD